jgi:cobalt-zinc-cadmium efflux system outer membrane protein
MRAGGECRRASIAGAELAAASDAGDRDRARPGAAVARFEADAIERLPRGRAMAEASYRSGRGSIVELLDALDAITEARLRDIELIAAALHAELDVRAAAGSR